MNRVLIAGVLAVLFHGVLLGLNAEWLSPGTARLPQRQVVTVTMSYRKPSVPQVAAKAPIKRLKVPTPKKVKIPKKPEPVLATPQQIVMKPAEVEKVPVHEPETTLTEDVEEAFDEQPEIQEESKADGDSDTDAVQVAIPLYKYNPKPRYPRSARRRGIQGKVVLSVYVDENGRVGNVWVFESSGYRILDNEALKTVLEKWLFKPGMNGDKKIAIWVKVPVRFELK